MSRTSICYAVKKDTHHFKCGFAYMHVYPSAFPTHLSVPDQPIYKLRVTEQEDAPKEAYWAWWDNSKQEFLWVYPTSGLLEMIFPYGSKPEIEHGRGIVCQVAIEELGAFTEAEAEAAHWTP